MARPGKKSRNAAREKTAFLLSRARAIKAAGAEAASARSTAPVLPGIDTAGPARLMKDLLPRFAEALLERVSAPEVAETLARDGFVKIPMDCKGRVPAAFAVLQASMSACKPADGMKVADGRERTFPPAALQTVLLTAFKGVATVLGARIGMGGALKRWNMQVELLRGYPPPKGRPQPFHIDFCEDGIVIVVYLDDAPRGGTAFLKASHAESFSSPPHVRLPLVDVCMPPMAIGDVIIFNPSVYHSGQPVRDVLFRDALFLSYQCGVVPSVFKRLHAAASSKKLRVSAYLAAHHAEYAPDTATYALSGYAGACDDATTSSDLGGRVVFKKGALGDGSSCPGRTAPKRKLHPAREESTVQTRGGKRARGDESGAPSTASA